VPLAVHVWDGGSSCEGDISTYSPCVSEAMGATPSFAQLSEIYTKSQVLHGFHSIITVMRVCFGVLV
jgi:hypothetical protein